MTLVCSLTWVLFMVGLGIRYDEMPRNWKLIEQLSFKPVHLLGGGRNCPRPIPCLTCMRRLKVAGFMKEVRLTRNGCKCLKPLLDSKNCPASKGLVLFYGFLLRPATLNYDGELSHHYSHRGPGLNAFLLKP